MIRLHLVLALALAQLILPERLVLTLATGGRGMVMLLNLVDPLLVLALVAVPFRAELGRALRTRRFVLQFLPFLALSILLPFLGVALNGYPARSAYTAWDATLPLAFVAIGVAGAARGPRAAKVAQAYFLIAVLAQFGLALVQAMGQFEYLPGVLGTIYEWDFRFKELHQPDNLILGRATGFYLNPNSLGIWALLAAWTSFFLLAGRARALGFGASVATILLCQSRGTLAAFLVSGSLYGLVWLFLRAGRTGRLKGTLFALACAVPLLVASLPGLSEAVTERLATVPVVGKALDRYTSGAKVLSEGSGADENFRGRVHFWKAAWNYLSVAPFGSLGSPEMVVGVPSDNQFVAVLEQGSFYYCAALLLVFLGTLRLVNASAAHERLLAVCGLGLVVNGISAVPFAYSASFLFWLLLGVHLAGRTAPAAAEAGP